MNECAGLSTGILHRAAVDRFLMLTLVNCGCRCQHVLLASFLELGPGEDRQSQRMDFAAGNEGSVKRLAPCASVMSFGS